MVLVSSEKIRNFQKKVWGFYAEHKRVLPWRLTSDPYRVLVSEVMLQQTQVDRVIPKFEAWIEKWPSIEVFARASRVDVLTAWMGLGYNGRALRLHETSKMITENFNGDVVRALKEGKLPGVGPYTKKAVLIFAGNENEVTIDTNIRRILIHEFGLDESSSVKDLECLARECLPRGRSREWHNALMDYGALYVTARKTGVRSLTRQSRFEGSDRQLRALLLKYFLLHKQKSFSFSALQELTRIDESRLRSILEKMVNEGFLLANESGYRLKS